MVCWASSPASEGVRKKGKPLSSAVVKAAAEAIISTPSGNRNVRQDRARHAKQSAPIKAI